MTATAEQILNSFRSVLPEALLLAAACGLFLAAAFVDSNPRPGLRHRWGLLSGVALAAALILWMLSRPSADPQFVLGPFRLDALAWLTRGLVLVGGAPTSAAPNAPSGLDRDALAALLGRYGSETPDLLAMGAERELLGRLHPDADYLEVEVAWAVERELALSLDDILARRLRLAIETADHGASVATRVAEIVGPTLGWDDGRQATEVAAYTASSAREYGVPG